MVLTKTVVKMVMNSERKASMVNVRLRGRFERRGCRRAVSTFYRNVGVTYSWSDGYDNVEDTGHSNYDTTCQQGMRRS